MAPPRTIDTAERRARLGARHALAAPVATAEAATAAVAVLHSSDPVSVHLSARARTGAPADDVERALYRDGSLVRVHGMRRTLWVVPAALEPAVRVAGSLPLVANERKRLLGALAGVVPDAEAWLDAVADDAVEAVVAAGDDGASAAELGRAVPALATKVTYGAGTKWASEASVA